MEEKNTSKKHKIYALSIIILFLIPNLFFIIVGIEIFPFTCAPMFGHYIGDETPIYNFRFIAEYSGDEEILPSEVGGRNEMMNMRFFFSKVYGSTEEISPFGSYLAKSRSEFENRLGSYFNEYVYLLKKDRDEDFKKFDQLRLEVWKYNKVDKVIGKHIIGYYYPNEHKFKHVWGISY